MKGLFSKLTGILTLSLMASPASACLKTSQESIVFLEPTQDSLCYEITNSVESLVNNLLSMIEPVDIFATNNDYWSTWALQNEEDPMSIYTQQVSSHFIGFSVWQPIAYAEESSEMSYDEWIKSHGLQLSVGLGETKGKEPRMRIDYQWHDEHEDIMQFQVEVPF
jgi:hypothetical protein